MNRKVEMKDKKGTLGEKHIKVARTLSEAAELTEKMDETKCEIHEMMRKFRKNAEVEK